MKIAEIILGIVGLIGITFSFMLWPGGSALTILAFTLLSFIYFSLSFALLNGIGFRQIFKNGSFKGISGLRIAGAIGTGMNLAIIVIGLVFKLMRWPGASAMLFAGIIPLVIIAIVATIKFATGKSAYYKRILVRTAIFVLPALFLIFYPTVITEIKYRNFPEYIKAYKAADANPYNEALRQKEQDELEKINSSEGYKQEGQK